MAVNLTLARGRARRDATRILEHQRRKMSDSYSLLILPGDGIGPEVMAEVRLSLIHI